MTGAILTSCTNEQVHTASHGSTTAVAHSEQALNASPTNYEPINAAPLYAAAFGIPDGMPLDEWVRDREDAAWMFLPRVYLLWKSRPNPDQLEWLTEEFGMSPSEFVEWVEENKDAMALLIAGSGADHVDFADFRVRDLREIGINDLLIRNAYDFLFAAAIHAASERRAVAAREYLIASVRVFIQMSERRKEFYGVDLAYRMVREILRYSWELDLQAILDGATRHAILAELNRLSPDDPFGVMDAVQREIEWIFLVNPVEIHCQQIIWDYVQACFAIWDDPDAWNRIEFLKSNDPHDCLKHAWTVSSAWHADHFGRQALRELIDLLEQHVDG